MTETGRMAEIHNPIYTRLFFLNICYKYNIRICHNLSHLGYEKLHSNCKIELKQYITIFFVWVKVHEMEYCADLILNYCPMLDSPKKDIQSLHLISPFDKFHQEYFKTFKNITLPNKKIFS